MKKGYSPSMETRQKLREINLGKTYSQETRDKKSISMMGKNKGKKHSAEARQKMSLSAKTRKRHPMSEKTKEKLRKIHTGMKFTLEQREKLCGDNHPNWQGGKTPLARMIRNSLEYKLWRASVFERDNYTCLWCGIKGGWNKALARRIVLNADHIKPFAQYPELRLAIDNGRTLCQNCHRATESFGRNRT